jgi:hypothetical protein
MIRRQWRNDIKLDKSMLHFKAKHKGDIPSEGRSLLDMGFTVAGTRGDSSMPMEAEESAGPGSSRDDEIQQHRGSAAALTENLPPRP